MWKRSKKGLTKHASNVPANDQIVVILSLSGNTDIIVITIVYHSIKRVITDNDKSEAKKMIVCDQIIDNEQCSEMIVFDSFTGYDYTSSFFRQGKKPVWSQNFLPHYQYCEIKSHLMMKHSTP